MIVGQVDAKGRPPRKRPQAHRTGSRRNPETAERRGAVVAAQAKPACPHGLLQRRLQRGAGVKIIRNRREIAVPQSVGLAGAMGRVAENAQLSDSGCLDRPRSGNGQVMDGIRKRPLGKRGDEKAEGYRQKDKKR